MTTLPQYEPTAQCKTELLRWRSMFGPDAGIDHFWIYNLRHTFASRLSAAGVSDLFVAQMIRHNSPGILQKYSKAIDEYRRDAVRKLEGMRAEYVLQQQHFAKITTVLLQ